MLSGRIRQHTFPLSKWCLKYSLAYKVWWRLRGSQILLCWSSGATNRKQGKPRRPGLLLLTLNQLIITPLWQSQRNCPRLFSKIPDCVFTSLCFPGVGCLHASTCVQGWSANRAQDPSGGRGHQEDTSCSLLPLGLVKWPLEANRCWPYLWTWSSQDAHLP